MKTVHTIMVMAAILSVPMALGTQNAIAGSGPGSTATTASVDISAVCELTAPTTLSFAGGDPETNGAGVGVGETAAFNLANTNGNLQSIVTVWGSNWYDQAAPANDVMEETHTVFSTTSGGFGGKTPVGSASPGASVTTIAAGDNQDTFWDVEIVLDIDASFAGTANQDLTFEFSCN